MPVKKTILMYEPRRRSGRTAGTYTGPPRPSHVDLIDEDDDRNVDTIPTEVPTTATQSRIPPTASNRRKGTTSTAPDSIAEEVTLAPPEVNPIAVASDVITETPPEATVECTPCAAVAAYTEPPLEATPEGTPSATFGGAPTVTTAPTDTDTVIDVHLDQARSSASPTAQEVSLAPSEGTPSATSSGAPTDQAQSSAGTTTVVGPSAQRRAGRRGGKGGKYAPKGGEEENAPDGTTLVASSGPYPGGPVDGSLLKGFQGHVAYHLWSNRDARRPLLCVNHQRKILDWSLGQMCKPLLERVESSGLLAIAKHGLLHIDGSLLSAFVERWQPETNSFHFGFGEMTVTLDDVDNILGIPLVGKPVYSEMGGSSISSEKAKKLLVEGLGVEGEEAMRLMKENRGNVVKLTWLRDTFSGVSISSTPEELDRSARAYLLYLLGSVLFTNKTRAYVPIYFMSSLMDLAEIKNHAWGMAVLAHLYRELGKASRFRTFQLSGCVQLLEVWIYEHFKVGRCLHTLDFDPLSPRIERFTKFSIPAIEMNGMLREYRETLDDILANEVIWEPYLDTRESHPFKECAMFRGVLINYDDGEPYYPDRVLRQFGRVQTMPRNPIKPEFVDRGEKRNQVTYSISPWLESSWEDFVLHPKFQSTPVQYPWECSENYMEWYSKVCHPRIQYPAHRVSPMRSHHHIHHVEDVAARNECARLHELVTQTLVSLRNCQKEGPYDMNNKWVRSSFENANMLSVGLGLPPVSFPQESSEGVTKEGSSKAKKKGLKKKVTQAKRGREVYEEFEDEDEPRMKKGSTSRPVKKGAKKPAGRKK